MPASILRILSLSGLGVVSIDYLLASLPFASYNFLQFPPFRFAVQRAAEWAGASTTAQLAALGGWATLLATIAVRRAFMTAINPGALVAMVLPPALATALVANGIALR